MGVVNFTSLPFYPRVKNPISNSVRVWVGTRGGLDVSEKKINPSTEFRTLGLLARNLSLLPHSDRCECNTKMDYKGAEYHVLNWIHLAQDPFLWWDILNTLMDFWGSRFLVLLAVFVENQVFWNVTLCHLASIFLVFRSIVVNSHSSARSMTWTFFWTAWPRICRKYDLSTRQELPAHWPTVPPLGTRRFKWRVS